MSEYLEIPELNKAFPFRSFINEGEVLVYPHWHKEIEIIYALKGSLNLGINDMPIQLKEGEIQIINGGDVHYFLASPNSERIVIQFDLSLFQEEMQLDEAGKTLREMLTEMAHLSRDWPEEVASKMQSLIQEIHSESSENKPGKHYILKADLLAIIVLIYREIPQIKTQPDSVISEQAVLKSQETLQKLDQIFSYVEKHYQEPVSLQEVADYTGFSTYYFTKFFKRNTGMTFVTFLNDYRLNKAKWMLLNEAFPVTEVAELAGFSSVKTFHHAFKRAMGVAPLKYRKAIYGNN
ncbi:AraC family transcriptional regulator [Listeria seeligeri]|uniref:acid resistance transcriptional regulator GadR n=1 Tax=Listeria seeligeri TaxID=1640 RepID=UPI0022EBD6EC|nr:AraC family transcriptional regulator [Listeria seeligeri]